MGWHGAYKSRKFEVGERLLALRTRTKLTQTELAELVGVSRRSIQGWEAGTSYPQEDKLQSLIRVFLTEGALTPGQEYEEALSLWRQVNQDAPLRVSRFDEKWFATLLAGYATLADPLLAAGILADQATTAETLNAPISNLMDLPPDPHLPPLVDWGEAPDISELYGREAELATLHQWVLFDRCRVVALLGLGGIGKTSLALTFANQAAAHFDAVYFRSLRNTPALDVVLDSLIHAASSLHATSPEGIANKTALLIQLFRERRYLLVLDNLETILQPGAYAGQYRSGYEEYGLLIQRLGEIPHTSCLLLTSREKPSELGPLESPTAPVRSLSLAGLANDACRAILEEKAVFGVQDEVGALANLYGGNPLALKLISDPIHEVFGGDLHAFLATGDAFFNGVGKLLDQQFHRSALTEKALLYWLAIERELVSLDALLADFAGALSQRQILMALESLRRRQLIERSVHQLAFTLQPVIMEYLTDRLVEHLLREIVEGEPELLQSHLLVQATTKDYVRHTQERLIATALLEQLVATSGGAAEAERRLIALLQQWREQPMTEQGYGPGNVVNLLRLLRGHLRHLNLAHLAIRQAHLQGVEMQDSNLTNALLQDSVFTETFGAMTAVAISSSGEYWAASSRNGEVLVWGPEGSRGGHTLHRTWQANPDMVPTLTFSPDGRTLATSGPWEGSVKLWDVARGALLWVGRHMGRVNTVAFCPDGSLLASSGDDATVRLWDVRSGTQLQQLPHPASVAGVDWSPDGTLLSSGDTEGTIHLWAIQKNGPAFSALTITGHTARVDALAFSPDGHTLASASWDGLVKVWELSTTIGTGEGSASMLYTLTRHTDRVVRVAWSPDGRILASCGHDPTIWLWDVTQGTYRTALNGHSDGVYGVAFTADGRLLSSSEDGTLRVWDVVSGQCLRVMQGYTASLCDVGWSPDGTQLISGGTDRTVTIHAVDGATPARILRGHNGIVLGVGWSHDGRWLASSEWDNIVRIWDATAGTSLQLLQHPEDSGNYFSALAWSPTGRLACATYQHGVLLWDMTTQSWRWLDHQRPTWIRTVAWNPDGTQLAGGDEQGIVYVWNADHGTFLQQMTGHHSLITSVAWSPGNSLHSTRLASGGHGIGGGELFVWDVQRGERIYAPMEHSAIVCSVAWGSSEHIVVSGDSSGVLRWWDLQRGVCVRVCEAHQGSVQSLRRSPDGTKLASCGDDGAILLWDLHSGDYLQTLRRDRPYERLQIAGLTGITTAQRAALIALGAVEQRD